jgi:hypothetical protein
VNCADHRPTVDVLPDDVLLEIFDFDRLSPARRYNWQWVRLVHVCQRWRHLIFSSPRRLDLRLLCSNGTPVKENLGLWPELPIVLCYGGVSRHKPPSPEDEENLVTALRQPDRLCEIWLTITGSLSNRLIAEMQKAMPALETLRLLAQDLPELLLTGEFLGGSASLLSVLSFHGIAFPVLPKFLLSSRNLVSLELWNIPRSGYFSPEALVLGLSAMTQLKSFTITFDYWMAHFHVSNLRTPPSGPTVLPALTHLKFHGVTEYSEAILTRIDTPLLESIDLIFFNRLAFEIPHLCHFIRRTSQLESPTHVKIASSRHGFAIALIRQIKTPPTTISRPLFLQITCKQFDSHLTNIIPISSQLSRFFSSAPLLELHAFPPVVSGRKVLDLAQWVELLRPFGRVKRLYVVDDLLLDIAQVLHWAIEEELLPDLCGLFFENLDSPNFIAALGDIKWFCFRRGLTLHSIYKWDTSHFR